MKSSSQILAPFLGMAVFVSSVALGANHREAPITALDHKDAKNRASAAKSLGDMGPDAKLAIRRLVKALKDPDENVRSEAVWALTELEAGSYVFMDTRYFVIGGKDNDTTYTDFAGALTVLTTVDSKRHPNQVAIDYGNKAGVRPTDTVKGMPWLQVGTQGAEYGILKWKDGDKEPKLGDRIEIYCTVLDDSTNYYDRYYVARGDRIVDAVATDPRVNRARSSDLSPR